MQASNLHAEATAFEAAASTDSANRARVEIGVRGRDRTDVRRGHIPERHHCATRTMKFVLLKAPEVPGGCSDVRGGVEPLRLGSRSLLHRTAHPVRDALSKMVGTAGLEPAAFCPPSRRATRLRYAP